MTRRWVVCADGTWNSRDQASSDGDGLTNVARMHDAVADIDKQGVRQKSLYHPGVGVEPSWYERAIGGAFGVGLSKNVQECYVWLVDNFTPGDEIFLFGFSRGAFTVRSLAGLIRKCGILRRDQRDMVAAAYDLYRDGGKPPNSPEAAAFRDEHSHPTPTRIKCLGVWDTVGALGMPTTGPVGWYTRNKYGFHDVSLNSWVENAFHALAIDERRKPFEPALWKIKASDVDARGENQRIEQVWFAGVHSNVGGGYPDARLSELTLEWMLERAQQCGLALETPFEPTLAPNCCGELYQSMTWYYKTLGQVERAVCTEYHDEKGEPLLTFESVHSSAFERRDTFKPPYAPRNLSGLPRVEASSPAHESEDNMAISGEHPY
jgi:uncharacterized protein (DUF2235 family)